MNEELPQNQLEALEKKTEPGQEAVPVTESIEKPALLSEIADSEEKERIDLGIAKALNTIDQATEDLKRSVSIDGGVFTPDSQVACIRRLAELSDAIAGAEKGDPEVFVDVAQRLVGAFDVLERDQNGYIPDVQTMIGIRQGFEWLDEPIGAAESYLGELQRTYQDGSIEKGLDAMRSVRGRLEGVRTDLLRLALLVDQFRSNTY
jgi:hypothetical protein